jgi:hypothetical protein
LESLSAKGLARNTGNGLLALQYYGSPNLILDHHAQLHEVPATAA